MHTSNPNGTPWNGWYGTAPSYSTGYPVPDVLNYKLGLTGTEMYFPVSYPSDTTAYMQHMVWSIVARRRGVLGDAYEVHNDPHLWGHPDNPDPIGHWFTISGYEDNGNGTNYMDSATTVWTGPGGVHGWNTNYPSGDMMSILGGRGYVW